MSSTGLAGRSAREWLSSMPACLLLLAVVIFSTSSDIHNKMLKMGQQFWDGYYNLRTDPVAPHCDPNVDIEAQLQARLEQERARQQGDDLIADRKSTRLNSSHVKISYAVFCLKKKRQDLA